MGGINPDWKKLTIGCIAVSPVNYVVFDSVEELILTIGCIAVSPVNDGKPGDYVLWKLTIGCIAVSPVNRPETVMKTIS